MAKQQFQFELYHESSKLRAGDIDLYTWIGFVNSDFSIRNVISKPVLEYGGIDEIELPDITSGNSVSLYESLIKRRSERNFDGATCTLHAFAALLSYSIKENAAIAYDDGVNWCFRPYPSGGALYPVDIYVYINKVENIRKGIYIYNPKKHSIAEIENCPDPESLKAALPTLEHEIDQSSFVIFLVSDLAKMSFKYQERAYRFALLECGHIAQNLLLCAASQQLKSFPVGAYMDDEVNLILNLDGVTSNIQYILFFGT